MFAVKYLALAHDWGAYFIYHYEEYLTSDFFSDIVWMSGNLWETFLNVAGTILWWGLVILYFVFWPITFPFTLVFGGGIALIIYLFFW